MAKYSDKEIVRGGSDFQGGKGSVLKGRAKTPDGKKLWTSENGFHYETEEEMKEADKEFKKNKKGFFDRLVASPEEQKKMAEDYIKNNENVKQMEKTETETPSAEIVEQKEEKTETVPETKAEEKKDETVPEETVEEEETETEGKPEEPKEEIKQADENTVEQIASGKGTVAEYLASEHPSTIGYIANRIKNGDIAEALRVSIKSVASVLGGALFANGMSLLGDNSFFAKIGDGTKLENLTSDEQKKVADAITGVQSAQAQDTIANKKIVDKWLPELNEEKKALIVGSGFSIATLDDDKLTSLLKQKKFTEDEIKNVINIKPMLKYSSAQAIENVSKIAGTKTVETAEKKASYDFTVEQFQNVNALRQQIKDLEAEKLNVSKANAKDLVALASSIAAFYGSATEAQNKSKNFGWNVNADASIKLVASVAGGVQGASSSGESASVSGFTEEGKEKALQAIEKMSNEEINQYKADLIKSYDEAIAGIRKQIAVLENKVDDAVIPNGEIDSVNLKDGTTLEVNENDGAVITTNPLPEGLLSFAEGEVNPFDYLGYDGEKKECEYYDTIFDEKEKKCNSFEDALALLD